MSMPPQSSPDQPPAILNQVVEGLARHGLTALAGILASAGYLSTDQTTQFVTLGASLVTFLLGVGWSIWQKKHNSNKLVAAAVTGDPSANPNDPATKRLVATTQGTTP